MDKTPFSVYDFFAYLSSGAVILAAVDYVFGTGILFQKDASLFFGLALVIFGYITGQAAAHISSTVFEYFMVGRVLQSPSLLLLGAKPRWAVFKWLFPQYHRQLPRNIQEQVLQEAHRRGCRATGEGLFLHAYPLVTVNEKLQARLDDFRNQYGFARNMSFATFVAATAIAICHKYGPHPVQLRWSVLAAFASITLFYRYLKFFRQYTYELFVRYAALPKESAAAVGSS